MPINELNIKLMAPQNLSDQDDGGGRMTGIEIVDGNVNDLFDDISRLDRVYGRVSLREGFVFVDTADQEMYSGAHLILTNPAKDPLVNVCLFSTVNDFDFRTAAQDRIEAYVTQGPRYFGWLWGNQLEGSRALLLFQSVDTSNPEVGDVLYLVENEGLAEEYFQYVRITEVTTETIQATVNGKVITRKVVNVSIGDPLRHTFHGGELSGDDASVFEATTYTTTIADAAKYYGAMELTAPLTTGDITVNVDSIFTHLVPSAQSEAPLLDLNPGDAGPVTESGASRTITAPSFACADGAQFFFGRGMKPGTVTVSGGRTYTDDSTGLLMEGQTVSGTVDYGLGTITFEGATSWTAACAVTAVVATAVSRINNTMMQTVDINNRGYNYIKILNPAPMPGTLIVDYMSQGKWYRLRDNGNGELVPDLTGTGTGTINYITGSCLLTCAALPDVDSAVLYGWGNPVEISEGVGTVSIDVASVDHTIAEAPVAPNSLSISWPSGAGSATITDDGSGNLTGDGTGSVNYATGRCLFTPTLLPAMGASYTFDYDKWGHVSENAAVSVAAGMATIQLSQVPVKAGSVNLLLEAIIGGVPHLYSVTDNGAGAVAAAGWQNNVPVSWPEWDGKTDVSGLSGTIDAVLGIITIDVSSLTIDEITFVPVTTLVEVS